MFLFTFIGSVLFLFGVVFIEIQRHYNKHGQKIRGKVVAIEKYTTHTGSKNDGGIKTLYRPIYEYPYKNEKIWISGAGQSHMTEQINDPVTILSLPEGPDFCTPQTNTNYVIGSMFMVMGTLALALSLTNMQDSFALELAIIMSVVLPALLIYRLPEKSKIRQKISKIILKRSPIENQDSLKGRQIFWNNTELEVEHYKVRKGGFFVSLSLLALLSWISIQVWKTTATETREDVLTCLQARCGDLLNSGHLKNSNILALVILGLLVIIAVSSTLYSYFKIKRPKRKIS